MKKINIPPQIIIAFVGVLIILIFGKRILSFITDSIRNLLSTITGGLIDTAEEEKIDTEEKKEETKAKAKETKAKIENKKILADLPSKVWAGEKFAKYGATIFKKFLAQYYDRVNKAEKEIYQDLFEGIKQGKFVYSYSDLLEACLSLKSKVEFSYLSQIFYQRHKSEFKDFLKKKLNIDGYDKILGVKHNNQDVFNKIVEHFNNVPIFPKNFKLK